MRKKLHQLNLKRFQLIVLLLLCSSLCFGQSLDLKFDQITSENGLPQNTIHGIVKDKYGFMWFGTWSGLCRYDGYRFRIYRRQPGSLSSINNNRIHNIIKDEQQNLWVLTFDETAICKYNYETDDFERIPLSKVSPALWRLLGRKRHYINEVFSYKDFSWNVDSTNNMLVQTYMPAKKAKVYSTNFANRWSLNDSYITDIYLDNQNIFWAGTYSNGVNKSSLYAKAFHYFFHDVKDGNSIIDNNIRAMSKDRQGNLWIGTRDKGITIIGKNKTYRHIQYTGNWGNSINCNQIKKLYSDSRGFTWIGTKKGLDQYNPATQQIRHFEEQDLKNTSVFGMMEDHSGNMWFASWKGVYQYLPQADRLIHYNSPDILDNNHTTAIIEDSAHRIWVGTEGGGINLLEQAATGQLNVVTRFTHNDGNPNTISDDRIYSIYEDAQKMIWIGTGNGLDHFNPKTHVFRHFSISSNGQNAITIAGIIEDNNGSVWVSHKTGISKIDKKTFAISTYSLHDGLQSNEFSENAVLKDPLTGMLYFGGNNGYNAFYPDSIKADKTLPYIVFTELQILNKPVEVNAEVNGRILLRKPLYLNQEISLTYKDKSIAIEFAGLHFANPSGNKYAYMLEGFDKDWIYTDASRRVAAYSNLARGTYTFKVKASNSDGVWTPVPKTLKIVVLPPWWLSFEAYIVYTLILVGLMYAFYYYSVRYARLKSKLKFEAILHGKELELRQSKIEFFTNISHEIKTPLSLILAPIEKMMTIGSGNSLLTYQLQTLKKNGDRLLKLINQLLDIRKFETGNDPLMLEVGDLTAFVKGVVDSFRQLAAERGINLEFSAPNAAFSACFDPDKIEKVLYNLLSNSFKFTDSGGKIEVCLRQINEDPSQWIVIDVIDNGSGIPEKELSSIFNPFQQASSNKSGGTGLGLAYAKALIELHGGTIVAQSNAHASQKNTCFTVRLPIVPPDTITKTAYAPPFDDEEAATLRDDEYADNITRTAGKAFTIDGKAPVLLLVEDNFELRKYLKNCFVADYTILEAANGLEGITMADKHMPDLIVSDLMMPEMDGLELCKRLKSDVLTSHIPIILLTAKTPIEYQIEGIEMGADDYIIKPFNLKLLSLKIRNLLISKMRLREKYKSKFAIQPILIDPVSPDEKLLKKVLDLVQDKLSDPALNVDEICDKAGLSRTQLYRKMKALTGLSMAEVIKDVRLKRAQQLLSGKKFNVNEITYMVGFTDADYFRKCFKSEFGVTPSEYAKGALQTEQAED